MDSNIFSSDRCRGIYCAIVEFYNRENLIFDTDAFKVYLENRPQSERSAYLKLWKNIIRLKRKTKRAFGFALVVKLGQLYRGRLLEYGISKTVETLKKAVNGGYDLIEKAKESYISVVSGLEEKKTVSLIVDPFAHYGDFKKRHIAIQQDPSLLNAIPTGMVQLDDIMGGLRPSEFGLITAGTGIGKSILLGDFAFHCFKTCGDVLYVSIEMPAPQLSERIFCRMSGINYEYFRNYSLSRKHFMILNKKIKKLINNHEYKYRILDMPQSTSVKNLRLEIEEFIEENWEPKLILIDYLNILHGGFDWGMQLENAVGVKQQIARYFKIATWSANQLMGSKHDKEFVGIQDMAFAKNIVDNVDIGIGIGMTDLSEEEEVFNITFTKTRDFKGKGFTIQGDRSRMTFTKSIEKKTKFQEKLIGGEVKI